MYRVIASVPAQFVSTASLISPGDLIVRVDFLVYNGYAKRNVVAADAES